MGCTLQGMTTQNRAPWLTVKAVAEELSASPMTVYRLIDSGELKALRMGARSIRIKREHLEEYLENQTAAAAVAEQAQSATDRAVEQFLFEPVPTITHPDWTATPLTGAMEGALKAHGYSVPAAVLAGCLALAESALEQERLQKLREAEGGK